LIHFYKRKMAEGRAELHACELCGAEGFNEDDLRSHMRIVHVEGSQICPFCQVCLSSRELQVHVNTDHLDFLTPESEGEGAYLEGGGREFGSLWELEKCAGEGITQDGLGLSPCTPGNPFNETPEDSDTEDDMTLLTSMKSNEMDQSNLSSPTLASRTNLSSPTLASRTNLSSPSLPTSSNISSLESSPVKRLKGDQLKKQKSSLSLPLKRPTGGCTIPRPLSSSSATSTAYSSPAQPSPTRLTCPMCSFSSSDPLQLEAHVNRQHLDQLSPDTQVSGHQCPLCSRLCSSQADLEKHFTAQHTDMSPEKGKAADANGNITCPVCAETCWNTNLLQIHVEKHFSSPGPSTKKPQSALSDAAVAQEIQRRELAKQKYVEEKEFASLRAQYGMDNEGNFRAQSEQGLMAAVSKGELSITDFYEKKADIANSVRSGLDDGSSRTPRISETIHSLSIKSPGVKTSLICGRVDHLSSTYGDKGWGCGFRNLQMMLSYLLSRTQYRESIVDRVFKNKNLEGAGVPSIPRLQEVLEAAWQEGFDTAGCEQLGGKIVNTRKWIGATEIFSILSSCGVKAKLVDFHKPSGDQGTHPLMVEWVWNYFRQGTGLPPLYLQHQGHSRTICGIERTGTVTRLLVLDPSHNPRAVRENPLRMVRKTLASMKSPQYQIVAVVGTLTSAEREEFRKRPISSTRIP